MECSERRKKEKKDKENKTKGKALDRLSGTCSFFVGEMSVFVGSDAAGRVACYVRSIDGMAFARTRWLYFAQPVGK